MKVLAAGSLLEKKKFNVKIEVDIKIPLLANCGQSNYGNFFNGYFQEENLLMKYFGSGWQLL